MTTVASVQGVQHPAPEDVGCSTIRVALLGLGQVGGAIADLARRGRKGPPRFVITSALVRDTERRRQVDTGTIVLTSDPAQALTPRPDVVVEALGGIEPARTLVLTALAHGIPVVTANKSLLALHGDELFSSAARTGTALLYEASVIAGVPFLGTFSRRPWARDVTAMAGVVNGTSNFILSRMAADRVSFSQALADAQRAGYAEPDPSKDVLGDDAVEKLCVLIRHFAGWSVAPDDIEKKGITELDRQDLERAATFGGSIRPVVAAEWERAHLTAYAGPAFVPASNGLARVDGVQNAIALRTRWSGDLFLSGPGAGPTVTAATVLDDVVEAYQAGGAQNPVVARSGSCTAPTTGWFIRLTAGDLRDAQTAPGLLGTLGIRMCRTSPLVNGPHGRQQWLLTAPCARDHIAAALDVLSTKTGGNASMIRVLE